MTEHLLDEGEIRSYHDKGYVLPKYRLPGETLESMRQAYRALLEANPGISADFMLGPHLENPGAQGLRGSRKWLEFATTTELMDIAAQLVGANLILWGTTIFGKPARQGLETPWHQDGDYYPIRPLETLTIWIALDDVTPENGPLRMIPGSHRDRKIYSHHWDDNPGYTINQVCDPEHFDQDSAEDLVLEAGQMSFHDVYMIHGSNPNRSDSRRAAFIIRLMPASSHYDHELGQAMGQQHLAHDYGYRPLFLVRGRDSCGNNDFTIGH